MCDIQLVKTKLEGRKETLVASSASTLSLRKCLQVIYMTGKQSQGQGVEARGREGRHTGEGGAEKALTPSFQNQFCA